MNDGTQLNIKHIFETISCYKCQILFAVPAESRRRWQDTGQSFYCPNGHSQCYTETNVSKLEKKLKQERKQKEWAQQDAENSRKVAKKAEHQRRAQKGLVTKLKNRAKAGICPCCNRHFKQLSAHMKNKHPDFCGEK